MFAQRKHEENMSLNPILEPSKNTYLDQIITELKSIEGFTINNDRELQIIDFIKTTVNGDKPQEHCTKEATLDSKNEGIVVFILTDKRLIKFQLSKNDTESTSYPFNTYIGIKRKLLDENKIEIIISFQSGSIGLKFPQYDKKLNEFLQKVEAKIESQEMRAPNNG